VDSKENQTPKQWNVTVYNLTNVAAVLTQGATPHFQEVGPYRYNEWYHRYNTQFTPNGANITYKERNYYDFLALDPGLSFNDTVIVPWFSFAGFALEVNTTDLTQISVVLWTGYVINYLQRVAAAVCIGQFPITTACQTAAAMQWANLSGLVLPDAVWTSPGQSILNSTKTEEVMDPTILAIFQGTYSRSSASIFPEFGASLQAQSNPGLFANETLMFGILWGNGTVATAANPCPLTMNFLLNTTSPFFGQPCLVVLVQLANLGDLQALHALFPGLTNNSVWWLMVWMRSVSIALPQTVWSLSGVLDASTFKSSVSPPTKLLWVSRTIQQLLFNFPDPLLVLLGQTPTSSAIFSNDTTDDVTTATQWKLLTGMTDPDDSQMVLGFDGYSDFLPPRSQDPKPGASIGVWCNNPVPIQGHYVMQLTPGTNRIWSWDDRIDSSSQALIWVEELYRAGTFQYVEDITLKGIDLLRFRISDASLQPDPLYSMEYVGLINLTCPKSLPIMMSQYRFFRATNVTSSGPSTSFFPDSWRVEPTSLYQCPNAMTCDALLDIEPTSGASMQGYLRLQINLLAEVNSQQKLLPVVYVQEYSVLTDSQASDFKNQVYYAFNVKTIIFWSLVVVGMCMAAIFIGVGVWAASKQRAQPTVQYTNVYEESLLHPDLAQE